MRADLYPHSPPHPDPLCEYLCTFTSVENIVDKLYAVIEDRKKNPPAKSYVASLFAGGVPKIAAKVEEEAAEFTAAAACDDEAHFIYEAADLFFHIFVMLGEKGVHPDQVFAELARRFGVSGIDEKEARKSGGGYAAGQR
jgi:phosphoribosyl-ATP pyrophosphohydrolase